MRPFPAVVLAILACTSARANTYEVGTLGTKTGTNATTITYGYEIVGEVDEFWVYVPIPQATEYSDVWTQTPVSGSVSTFPPGQLYQFDEGVWIDFGARSYETVEVEVASSVTVNSRLPGIDEDIERNGAGSWYQGTTRCQASTPGLSATIQNIADGAVAGTTRGNWGIVERWVGWLNQNVSHDTGNTTNYEQNDAESVYAARVGACAGFSNLFKAGLISLSPPFGVGIVLGATVDAGELIPGFTSQYTLTTIPGLHSWAVVDDGYAWFPVDAYHGTIGMATMTRITNGIYEDEGDGAGLAIATYSGPDPTITETVTLTGTSGSASYVPKRVRNPYPGDLYAMHWIKKQSLQALDDGFPVIGVPEDPILDPFKANTIRVMPNPAARWVELQLYLERDAHVTVSVLDTAGRQIATFVDEERSAGYNYALWEPSPLAAGVYFLRIALRDGTTHQVESARVILMQ